MIDKTGTDEAMSNRERTRHDNRIETEEFNLTVSSQTIEHAYVKNCYTKDRDYHSTIWDILEDTPKYNDCDVWQRNNNSYDMYSNKLNKDPATCPSSHTNDWYNGSYNDWYNMSLLRSHAFILGTVNDPLPPAVSDLSFVTEVLVPQKPRSVGPNVSRGNVSLEINLVLDSGASINVFSNPDLLQDLHALDSFFRYEFGNNNEAYYEHKAFIEIVSESTALTIIQFHYLMRFHNNNVPLISGVPDDANKAKIDKDRFKQILCNVIPSRRSDYMA